MADYDCDYCALQKNCKHTYESTDCIYNSIKDHQNFKVNESLLLLGRLLDIFKSNDMDDEIYKISYLINDLKYYYSEELKDEYNELIKD